MRPLAPIIRRSDGRTGYTFRTLPNGQRSQGLCAPDARLVVQARLPWGLLPGPAADPLVSETGKRTIEALTGIKTTNFWLNTRQITANREPSGILQNSYYRRIF